MLLHLCTCTWAVLDSKHNLCTSCWPKFMVHWQCLFMSVANSMFISHLKLYNYLHWIVFFSLAWPTSWSTLSEVSSRPECGTDSTKKYFFPPGTVPGGNGRLFQKTFGTPPKRFTGFSGFSGSRFGRSWAHLRSTSTSSRTSPSWWWSRPRCGTWPRRTSSGTRIWSWRISFYFHSSQRLFLFRFVLNLRISTVVFSLQTVSTNNVP